MTEKINLSGLIGKAVELEFKLNDAKDPKKVFIKFHKGILTNDVEGILTIKDIVDGGEYYYNKDYFVKARVINPKRVNDILETKTTIGDVLNFQKASDEFDKKLKRFQAEAKSDVELLDKKLKKFQERE
jgi:hypothetical protein